MNALLKRFVELIEVDLAAAGFVRRGPVFRYFDPEGNGIALHIQRTTAMPGEVDFFINVGVLLVQHLRYDFGEADPRLDAMPHHGVWSHRVVATKEVPYHTFSLSTDADVERAATTVRTWLAVNLPRMKSWLGDFDAMLAAIEEDRERFDQTRAGQLASGGWKAGPFAKGSWADGLIRVYALAERGDVDGVTAEMAGWDDGGVGSWSAYLLAIANQRRTEKQG